MPAPGGKRTLLGFLLHRHKHQHIAFHWHVRQKDDLRTSYFQIVAAGHVASPIDVQLCRPLRKRICRDECHILAVLIAFEGDGRPLRFLTRLHLAFDRCDSFRHSLLVRIHRLGYAVAHVSEEALVPIQLAQLQF